MAIVVPPTIAAMPNAPSASDPTTFDSRADAWLAALPVNITQTNSVASNVYNNATEAYNQAIEALAQKVLAENEASNAAASAALAQSAVLASNATIWVSAGTYIVGDCRFSPTNFQTYRCKAGHTGRTTDPITDTSYWTLLSGGEVTLLGAETISNKKVSAFYVLEKTYTNATANGTVNLDLTSATIFNLTLSNTATIGIASAPTLSNETLSFTVKITQPGTAYTLNWSFGTINWLTTGGTAPAAPAASKTIEYIFTTDASGVYYGRKGSAT